MSDTTVAAQDAAATSTPQPANLSVTDIQNAIRVIDFASDQGAFRGWQTIEQVLLVRNRLNDFVKAVLPPEDAAPADADGDITDGTVADADADITGSAPAA